MEEEEEEEERQEEMEGRCEPSNCFPLNLIP